MQGEKSTLMLRFAGPLQAWGASGRFNIRASEREPTKSATIGLIAAALGRRREDPIDDLVHLKFGVRIDQPGQLINDFHTAQTFDKRQSFVSNRHYMADAVYVVGIEGSGESLRQIERALYEPCFPLFLGRRSCPPAGKLVLGIRNGLSVEEAFEKEPWQASEWYKRKQTKEVYLETVIDADVDTVGGYTKNDSPISFNQEFRKYEARSVLSKINAVLVNNPDGRSLHDAMGAF
jgi:CRISPR system Cascade subunit CasD